MGVLGVAQEVLAAARVVQADDRAADERGAAEREQVVGRVVEQHRDVRRRARRQPLEEQVGEPHRLDEVLAMGPDAIAEADRRPAADVGIGRVRAQERRGIRRDERRLPRRRATDPGRMVLGSVRASPTFPRVTAPLPAPVAS